MRHGFERRQPETFIQGWEYENFCLVVKNTQHFDGHKSEETHIILYAAADDGPPQVRIPRKIISDDDEFEVGTDLIFFQFSLQGRKSFNHAYNVLVRADAACIEQKGVGHLIALGNQVAIGGGGVTVQKTLVDRVVHYLDAVGGNVEVLLQVGAGKVGNRENPRGPAQHSLGHLQMKASPETRLLAGARHMLQHVVHRHHVWAGQQARQREKIGDVNQVAGEPHQRGAKLKITFGGPVGSQ